MLTQDVVAQAGPYDIRVNCIAPEIILTDRNRERIPQAQQSSLADQHPIGALAHLRTWPAPHSFSRRRTRSGLPVSFWTLRTRLSCPDARPHRLFNQ
jgi:NAD(P)-dependent dehydrogenase (short-subunit alcohol dehydrogenase family)